MLVFDPLYLEDGEELNIHGSIPIDDSSLFCMNSHISALSIDATIVKDKPYFSDESYCCYITISDDDDFCKEVSYQFSKETFDFCIHEVINFLYDITSNYTRSGFDIEFPEELKKYEILYYSLIDKKTQEICIAYTSVFWDYYKCSYCNEKKINLKKEEILEKYNFLYETEKNYFKSH